MLSKTSLLRGKWYVGIFRYKTTIQLRKILLIIILNKISHLIKFKNSFIFRNSLRCQLHTINNIFLSILVPTSKYLILFQAPLQSQFQLYSCTNIYELSDNSIRFDLEVIGVVLWFLVAVTSHHIWLIKSSDGIQEGYQQILSLTACQVGPV